MVTSTTRRSVPKEWRKKRIKANFYPRFFGVTLGCSFETRPRNRRKTQENTFYSSFLCVFFFLFFYLLFSGQQVRFTPPSLCSAKSSTLYKARWKCSRQNYVCQVPFNERKERGKRGRRSVFHTPRHCERIKVKCQWPKFSRFIIFLCFIHWFLEYYDSIFQNANFKMKKENKNQLSSFRAMFDLF